MSSEGTELTTFHSLGDGTASPPGNPPKVRIKVNEDHKDFSDDDDNMMSGSAHNVPTPRSIDDDLTLALQSETTSTSSLCTRLCSYLSSSCGCCCCCVYTPSIASPHNYVSESSASYWKMYPFMRAAHRWWKVFLFCYLALAIPFIYGSISILKSTCYNADINNAINDYLDITGDSTDFCNLYFWLYLCAAPLLMLIVAYITERVTLHDDMRGDRLVCLLNAVCLLITIYFFAFLGHVDRVVMDYACTGDYQQSASDLLQSGCKS